MRQKEFDEFLDSILCQDYLVEIYLKYPEEKTYRHIVEFLEFDNDHYVWLNDWNEGEKDVLYTGIIACDDVITKGFEEAKCEYKC